MASTRTLIGLATLLLGTILVFSAANPVDYIELFVGIGAGVAGFAMIFRGRTRAGPTNLKVAYDFVAIPIIAVFVLSMLFGGLGGLLGNDQASLNLALFLLAMQAAAIGMSIVTSTFALAPTTGFKEFSQQLFWIFASFGGFFILNLVAPPSVPIFFRQSLAGGSNFVTLIIPVPEESLFRGWLAPWLGNLSRTGMVGGAIGSGLLFMLFHVFVYQTNPSALIVVFGAGIIEGIAAMKTGRLGTTISLHILNNFISIVK